MSEVAEQAEVLDAEVVEDETVVEETTSTVVAAPVARPGTEVLMPMDADRVVEGMEAYQSLLPRLLDSSDYQAAEQGKRFVKKSGWRKIARAFNLSLTVEHLHVERDADGNVLRAECVARATAPNGQVQDGDGYCSLSEFTGKRAGDVKLENTLRATATTRAKNRAIADLVGMGEVSAEEVTTSGAPPFEHADEHLQKAAKQALGRLAPTPDEARELYVEALGFFNGVCPAGLAVLIVGLDAKVNPPEQPDTTDLPKADDE